MAQDRSTENQLFRAIGEKFLEMVLPPQIEGREPKPQDSPPQFKMIGAGLGRAKTKTCTKGYSCGYTCLAKTKNCRSPLSGQHKDFASFLSAAVASGVALSPHHTKEAISRGLQTPPKPIPKTKAISQAIDAGDYQKVMDYAVEINTRARKRPDVKKEDKILAELYEDALYNEKPKIVTSDEITAAWQSGTHDLALRGQTKASYLDEYQNGTHYASGANVYGSGTYMSIANGSKAKDALDALDAIESNSYVYQNGVIFRMALPKNGVDGAVVVNQSSFRSEYSRIKREFNEWADREQKVLVQRAMTRLSPTLDVPDQFQIGNAENSIRYDLSRFAKKRPATVEVTPATPTTDGVLQIDYEPQKKQGHSSNFPSFRMNVDSKNNYSFIDRDGKLQSFNSGTPAARRTAAIQAATDDWIKKKAYEDAEFRVNTRARSRAYSDPEVTSFLERAGDTRMVLFGDEGNGIGGRVAVIRGITGVKLDRSYAANNFYLMLDRGKVMIQRDSVNYATRKKDVAG